MEVWRETVSEKQRKNGCWTAFQVLGIKPTASLTIGFYAYLLYHFARLALVGFCFMHSNNFYDTVLPPWLLTSTYGSLAVCSTLNPARDTQK